MGYDVEGVGVTGSSEAAPRLSNLSCGRRVFFYFFPLAGKGSFFISVIPVHGQMAASSLLRLPRLARSFTAGALPGKGPGCARAQHGLRSVHGASGTVTSADASSSSFSIESEPVHYRSIIHYDGTHFHGYQSQRSNDSRQNVRTVQVRWVGRGSSRSVCVASQCLRVCA